MDFEKNGGEGATLKNSSLSICLFVNCIMVILVDFLDFVNFCQIGFLGGARPPHTPLHTHMGKINQYENRFQEGIFLDL